MLLDRTPIPGYYCPSRRAATVYNHHAKCDYAGNAGTNENGQGDDGVIVRGPVHRMRLTDIHDGISNTVMVGERRLNAQQFGYSMDDNEPYTRPGWNGDWEMYRQGNAQPSRDVSNHSLHPYPGFGSAHANGFNTCFADGSVRHVRYRVNLLTWMHACVANDGLAFSLNEL